MNILESQVTDLNYLAESPINLSFVDSMNGGNSPATQSGTKRKADGSGDGDGDGSNVNNDGTSHTRAKRNRYISIAWYAVHVLSPLLTAALNLLGTDNHHSNECKRRKIKCNGNTPCQRCGNLNLECQYAPNCCTNGFKESEEFRQMNAQINSLQEQVNTLFANLNALRNGDGSYSSPVDRATSTPQPSSVAAISPASRSRPQTKHPSFRGPTSSAFSLDVAKNTLHSMGYQGLSEGIVTQDLTPVGSPPRPQSSTLAMLNGRSCRDPIWSLTKEEMVRLCRVYEEEMGIMYPVLNIEELIVHGTNLVRMGISLHL